MDEIERLNRINKVKIHSIYSKEFASYGRVLKGYDWSELIEYMKEKTVVPEERNTYVPSVEEMENKSVSKKVELEVYGGLPIEVGYCNGNTHSYNGFEYHKCSEINVAVTPFLLSLGNVWDIKNNTYETDRAEVFYIPEGSAIEIYGSTLHLAPHEVSKEGFKAVVILPKGTNTPFSEEEKATLKKDLLPGAEKELLFMRNKWIMAHPNWKPLISQGVYAGVCGENIETHFE